MNFPRTYLSFAVLSILSASIYANSNNDLVNIVTNKTSVQLSPLVLTAEEDKQEVGKTVYTKEDLEKVPNSSKNITDFLKVNPNVQFSNDHMAANSQADLKPSEISIHGAQSFQNKFVINGVSNSNILDPMGSGGINHGGPAGGSQGVAINTDLLCALEVLDSNVSAKFGGFTGGVIQAETCSPQTEIGKIHGSITYDYTESDWNHYHLTTDADKGLFEGESTQGNQKEYIRQGISTNLYSRLSEIYGIDFYVSQRHSKIPVASGLPSPKEIDQKKSNTNIGTTLYVDPDQQTQMKFGFTLGELEDNTYADKRRNSHNTVQNESALIFAEINKQYNWGKLKQKLNYQQIDNNRVSSSERGINWKYAQGSKDWNNSEGVWEGASSADIALKQNSINYEIDSIFNSFQFKDTTHQISVGFAYHYDDVKWKRTKDFSTFYSATTIDDARNNANKNLYDLAGQKCVINDPLCDENTTIEFSNTENGKKVQRIYQGQYFAKGNLFKAGSFDGTYQQTALYIEDDIRWKNISTRLGLRADYDESNNNLNFAPRTNIRYQPFSNDTLTLLSGWNRYYAAPTYMTDLRQSITSLDYDLKRTDQNSVWEESPKSTYNTDTRKTDLKTPYTDELVLGLTSQFKNTNLSLKWVNRQYQDEISRKQIGTGVNRYAVYANDGYAKNDTITLELNTLKPLKFYNTQHQLGLALNYSDSYRSTPDYSALSPQLEGDNEELVSYNSKIIESGDRPASNYNQPMTARLSWDIEFDSLPIKVYNYFSYEGAYPQTIQLTGTKRAQHNGKFVDTYITEDIKPNFTWDMRTTYDWKISKNSSVITGLTINNLTNRNNLYVSGNKLYSEIGRQFIADITFKF